MSNKKFSELKLTKSMLKNLEQLEYHQMTPVQADTIPHILENKDVRAQAKTGSGKTAAFGIGILNKLDIKKFRVQSLVLCPTRELADQVAKELRKIARFEHNIKILTLCGGVPFGPQLGSLKHLAHIVVGTPGRVLKHLEQKNLNLESMDSFILDEADRMLDMGFIKDIRNILKFTPKKYQTLLFSATFPGEIDRLSSRIQKNAVDIKTISDELPNVISEHFYQAHRDDKMSALVRAMGKYKPTNVIIFTNLKATTEEIASYLLERDIDAKALNGDKDQQERNEVLLQFANKSCTVLVATDVAARGLDIKKLAMVVNFDIPHDEEIYTHRIGRTGRAGEEGVAVTFYSKREDYKIDYYKDEENREFAEADSLLECEDYTLKAKKSTLLINGGKKDKVRPADILGVLIKEAGIDKEFIGKIDIFDKKSYVAIDNTKIDKARFKLKNGKIKNRKFYVTVIR